MDIHHLKVFLSVFKNRSFSKASEDLHLTQPTISSHIKALEDELEVRLFDRLGRTIVPTTEAEALQPRAAEAVESVEELKAAINLGTGAIRGELVIGASTIPGTYIIPAKAAGFRESYPDISFQVIIGDSKSITGMVSAGDLLTGAVGAVMEQKRLEYTPFYEDELIMVSSPKLPKLTNGKTLSVKEFQSLPFILREEGSGTRKAMERHFSEAGINPREMSVAATLGSTEAVKEAVRAGLGLSVISRLAAKEDLRAGRLVEVKIRGLGPMRRNFYIAVRRGRTLPAHYRAFLDFLKK